MKARLLFLLLLLLQVSVYAQNYKFGKVSKEEIEEKVHPQDPEAVAAVLYRDTQTKFDYSEDRGFYTITNVFERIKIYKKEGFDWATKKVRLFRESNKYKEEMSGLSANSYILDSNGKVEKIKLKKDGMFEEKINDNIREERFTMPSLKEGCVIEYEYTITSDFISKIDPFRFQETIPVNKVQVSFKVPEYLNYKEYRKGWIPFNINNNSNDRTISFRVTETATESWSAVGKTSTQTVTFREIDQTVDLENIPPLKQEAFAGNLENYTSSLVYELAFTQFPNSLVKTYSTDWESVSQSIYKSESFGGQLEKKRYFEEAIDNVIANAVSPTEKAVLIYEFVKNKMNRNDFIGIYASKGVKDAFESGVGNVADINLMLIAMLRYAKVNTNPVLISTKSNGIPLFPTRNGFNYVIAGVEVNNAVILLDASDKMAAPNLLNTSLLNWQGRLVREDGSSTWVPLQPDTPSQKLYMLNCKIAEDAQISGKARGQYSDYLAQEQRSKYLGINENGVAEKLGNEKLLVTDVKLDNKNNPYEPLKVEFNFTAEDYLEDINGQLYFSPLLFFAMGENPFKAEERNYPIDYGYPIREKYIINYEIPEGFVVESLPENANLVFGNDTFNFKYLVSNRNNTIQIMMDFLINTSLLSSDKYLDVKKFYQDLIDKEKEKIVLKKA